MVEVVQYQITGTDASSIAASVEEGARRGLLREGDPLPSVRQLAAACGVSPTTVASAYRELRQRGIVVTHDRSRTTISHRPPVPLSAGAPPAEGLRDVSSGNPDPALLPDLHSALERLRPPGVLYGDVAVNTELAALARSVLTDEGIDATELAVVSGALDGLERVLAAHLRPGDRVLVEDPCYTGVLGLCRAMGLHLEAVPIDDEGPLVEPFASALPHVHAVILTPRAQNPFGAAISSERRDRLRPHLDRVPEVLVVEDDHVGPLAGAPAVTLTSGRSRWARLRSVNKSLGPDLRVALLAGDAVTVGRVAGRQRHGAGWVSHILQRLVVMLWTDPATGPLLEHAEAVYTERRRACLAALGDHGIEAHGRSGLNVWVPVRDELAVLEALRDQGWALRGGAAARLGSPPAVRITIADLSPAESAQLAADLASIARPSPHTLRS